MTKKLIEIASEIVQTQVSLTPMSAGDIAVSLRQVFGTLQELQKAETAGTELAVSEGGGEEGAAEEKPALAPADSIQNDKVICLECGASMKQLTQKHLSAHGMTPREYKKKYGFTMRAPLAARSLTRARSKAAKKRGLPENLKKAIEAKRLSKAAKATSTTGVAETRKVVRRRGARKKAE
jgi:predicted transcriptional regulator